MRPSVADCYFSARPSVAAGGDVTLAREEKQRSRRRVAHSCLRREASISPVGSVRVRRRRDAVASSGYARKSGRRALEVACERCLDGRPDHGFAEERLDVACTPACIGWRSLVSTCEMASMIRPCRGCAVPSAPPGAPIAHSRPCLERALASLDGPFSKASSGARGLEWCPPRSIGNRGKSPHSNPLPRAPRAGGRLALRRLSRAPSRTRRGSRRSLDGERLPWSAADCAAYAVAWRSCRA